MLKYRRAASVFVFRRFFSTRDATRDAFFFARFFPRFFLRATLFFDARFSSFRRATLFFRRATLFFRRVDRHMRLGPDGESASDGEASRREPTATRGYLKSRQPMAPSSMLKRTVEQLCNSTEFFFSTRRF
jgi:hypothetical protein